MASQILELYPNPGVERPLNGTYLEHRLIELGTRRKPFVYANFVSSLDGRIAVVEGKTGESHVLTISGAGMTGGSSRSFRLRRPAW